MSNDPQQFLVGAYAPDYRTAGDILGEIERISKELGPIAPRMTRVVVRGRVELEALEHGCLEMLAEQNVELLEVPYMQTNRAIVSFADGSRVIVKIRKEGP